MTNKEEIIKVYEYWNKKEWTYWKWLSIDEAIDNSEKPPITPYKLPYHLPFNKLTDDK